MMRTCAVVPYFEHPRTLAAVAEALLSHGLACIVVDDGSGAAANAAAAELAARHPGKVTLVTHPRNRGKGAAVMSGMRAAAAAGFTHVLQIDADGQHDTADVPAFLDRSARHPQALVLGRPIFDASTPGVRYYGRYLTHAWVWINTLSLDIADSMCGFRVYPLAPVLGLAGEERLGERMDFDTEVLVRLHWRGVPMVDVPTRVTYPRDGQSHFRLWRDNVRISAMHARLFFGMLQRLPVLLRRRRGEALHA
jgi:glycosyltransferase involved in cell wall biosynthesis